jgi:RNA polymerase sigma-B factor
MDLGHQSTFGSTRRRAADRRAIATKELFVKIAAATDRGERRRLRAEVVSVNAGVARSIARRYVDKGEPLCDLEQTALMGLVKAVRRFDTTYQTNFLAYAVPTITGELKRYFRDYTWTIRPPRRIQELHQQVSRCRIESSQQLGRMPTSTEVAARLGRNVHQVDEAINAGSCFTPQSLSTLVGADHQTLADILPGTDDDRRYAESRALLLPLLAQLTQRERRVLELRFWCDQTQQQIADSIGATQMQVSRLLSRTLAKLRSQLDEPDEADDSMQTTVLAS